MMLDLSLYGHSRHLLEVVFTKQYVDNAIDMAYSFDLFLQNAPVNFQVSRNMIRGNPDMEKVCLIVKNDEHVQFFQGKKGWIFKDISNSDAVNEFGLEILKETIDKRYKMLILEKIINHG